ncbi:MAG: hypothetical protein JWO56_1927 [Acidobacteria bacterium]|nr:hypothetical protein [Acidobacteriota bacterium]
MRSSSALAIVFAAASALAQSKETINVSVVEVPVTVVDRGGAPVRGLTAANFELFDAGQKRAITAFDVVDFASPESLQATSPLNPAARRTFLLLFDLSFSSPKSLTRAQDAARNFLGTTAGRRDLVAVGTIDVEHGFRLLTGFTTDRNLLRDAIGNPSTFRAADPLQIAGNPIVKEPATPASGSGNTSAAAENQRETLSRAAIADDNYNRQRIDKQLAMLSGLAKTLHAVPGRKNVVLLSEGFDPRLVQGRGGKATREQQIENEAATHGELWNIDADSRFGNASSVSNLDRMAQMFRRSDVVLSAIDIQGLRVQNDENGARANSNEGLSLLSNPTGGTVFKNSNDLRSDLDRLLRAQEVVYVLAFQAPTSSPGRFHELKVKLAGVPGGARAVHRAGYYEAGGESAVERTLTNGEIILNDIPTHDVQVAVLAAQFPTKGPNAQVPVILEIDGNDLIAGEKGRAAHAEIFVYAFDAEGIVRDSLVQRMHLDMTEVAAKLKGSGIKYYGTLSLPEGTYAVKCLVQIAQTNRKGYARADVTVPGEREVSVSQPFFFEEPGRWFMIKGGSHDATNSPYPFEVNGETFIPAAAVHPSAARKFAVWVWNATPDELTLETTPPAKQLSKLRSADGRVTKATFALEGVPAGATSMTVRARKKGSGDERVSSVVFVP